MDEKILSLKSWLYESSPNSGDFTYTYGEFLLV